MVFYKKLLQILEKVGHFIKLVLVLALSTIMANRKRKFIIIFILNV